MQDSTLCSRQYLHAPLLCQGALCRVSHQPGKLLLNRNIYSSTTLGKGLYVHGIRSATSRLTGYVCMVIVTYSKGKDQPGKVANPACGQLDDKRKSFFPCPRWRLRIWSLETGSAVPSRVSLLISILKAESGALLRDSSRVPRRRPFIYFKPPYAIGSVRSLSGHALAYRWRSLPRVRRHRASKPLYLGNINTEKGWLLYCTVLSLYCTVQSLYCTVLYCHCSVLYCTVL